MANQKRRRYKGAWKDILFLLLICGVLIFAIVQINKKNQEAQDMPASIDTPQLTDVPADTEPDTAEPMTETAAAATEAAQTAPTEPETFAAAEHIHAAQQHIYIRIGHDKKPDLTLDPGYRAADLTYSVDDTDIADVSADGTVTGIQRGTCTLTVHCGDEALNIPVTVRELTVVDGCTYVDGILIANKSYSLPRNYNPGLLPVTMEAFEEMQAAATEEGITLTIRSDYRSYDDQVNMYNSMVNGYSEPGYADQYSARPGHSEHQTGYVIDCDPPQDYFADTPAGKWLAAHCWEYGFIIRYPEGKEDITGYHYESWHIRWLGVEVATEITEQGLTLEEYLDVDSHYADDEPTTEAEPEE